IVRLNLTIRSSHVFDARGACVEAVESASDVRCELGVPLSRRESGPNLPVFQLDWKIEVALLADEQRGRPPVLRPIHDVPAAMLGREEIQFSVGQIELEVDVQNPSVPTEPPSRGVSTRLTDPTR